MKRNNFVLAFHLSFLAIAGSASLVPSLAHGKSTPQVWQGDLPPDVKDHLKKTYKPSDLRAYLKDLKAQEIDLSNDGSFDLVVEADCGKKPPANGALPVCRMALYEKSSTRYQPIGELTCSDNRWRLADGENGQWEILQCGNGNKFVFDEQKHVYLAQAAAAATTLNKPDASKFSPEFAAGVDLYHAGKYAEAAEKLESTAGDHPTDDQLYYVGMANLKAHNNKRARETLGAISGRGYARAKLGLGDLLWDDGDAGGAVELYNEFMKTNPPTNEYVERARRRIAGDELPPAPKKKRKSGED